MAVPVCERCKKLLEEASSAIIQHLRAQSRLDLARCRREADLLPALRSVMHEAADSRTAALQAYKKHSAIHRV